jgi:hypothetical protein
MKVMSEFAKIQKVGIQTAAGDIDVDATTDPAHPALVSLRCQ